MGGPLKFFFKNLLTGSLTSDMVSYVSNEPADNCIEKTTEVMKCGEP